VNITWTAMALNGQCLHACHRLLADDGTDDWVPPQSHGPLMPTVFCNLYLYLYLLVCTTHWVAYVAPVIGVYTCSQLHQLHVEVIRMVQHVCCITPSELRTCC
jgi:hypothetical protein